MAVLSSKNGKVIWNGVTLVEARGWTLEQVSELHAYASNTSAGHRLRVAGHTDWTGTFRLYQDSVAQVTDNIAVGQSATLALHEDGTLNWSGTAMIASISPAIDIEAGDIAAYDVAFEANGTQTVPV